MTIFSKQVARPEEPRPEDEELLDRAWKFAINAHGDQKYGNEFPYRLHLLFVVKTLKEFGFTNVAILATGVLHDTLEDTQATYEELVTFFGVIIADSVAALTEPKGGNRKWRHEQTYPRTAQNTYAIIVKLADRIANVEVGGSKVGMYRKEHAFFKHSLYGKDTALCYADQISRMWNHLDNLLVQVSVTDEVK